VFSKFSPASGRVLSAAEQECRNHNHYYVGADHLLVALLEEQGGSIASRLAEEHIDPAEAYAQARRALGTGDDRMWEGILITPRVRSIVAIAEERAGDRPIEPVDLFDAILVEGRSSAAQTLRMARLNGAVAAPD